jgi:hypothetical protein
LHLPEPLHERVKASVPTILERTGFPKGDVTVAAVPDLNFRVQDATGRTWKVVANTLTGSLSGSVVEDTREPSDLSIRRYLLRLHVAHGYPTSGGVRWWWAIIVDAMAFIMVFWAVSGLLMWWQLKATRKLGVVMLLLSAGAAVWLALGMYQAFTQ